MIWFNKHIRLEDIAPPGPKTLGQHLGMKWVAITDNSLTMKMPVDDRTRQPHGILHGGASCALAETVGSIASHLVIDSGKFTCVGLEINANHIRSVKEGYIAATCIPLHIGSRTHVWDIKIHDDADRLICVSRLTVAILAKRK
jgi:1,4-dihydroxy-2-naphthoyl-CoA hydrolase